jgi:hypothetical protein
MQEVGRVFEYELVKEIKPETKKKRLDALQMMIKLQSLKKELEAVVPIRFLPIL